MSEKSRKLKYQLVIAGACLAGALGGTALSAYMDAGEEFSGLSPGDKITDVPVLTIHEGQKVTKEYSAPKDDKGEDLVVIYSKEASKIIAPMTTFDNKKYEAGLLVTEFSDGIYEGVVLFDKKTKTVKAIEQPNRLETDLPPIYADPFIVGPLDFSLDIKAVESGGDHGVQVKIDKPIEPERGRNNDREVIIIDGVIA